MRCWTSARFRFLSASTKDCKEYRRFAFDPMPPLVPVIIPVFNRAESLSLALRSVVGQTFTDWEAVVVADGSSDESAEVGLRDCEPGKVGVVRHENNLETSAARNSGIFAARDR